MKTAMQELIEKIEQSYSNELEVLENADKYHEGDVRQARLLAYYGAKIVDIAEKCLEKEKEQIIDAFNEPLWITGKPNIKAEDYYNQTYNQNK